MYGIISKRQVVVKEELLKMTSNSCQEESAAEIFISESKQIGFGTDKQMNSQLFSSEDYTLLFTGDLYNISDIEHVLSEEGKSLSYSTLAELLLLAYQSLGVDFVQRVEGVFTIAIWDGKTNDFYLFRDRLGQRPLFYSFDGETLYFSSKLSAVSPFVDTNLWNEQAIQQYFRVGYIPAPHTIYKEIQKLEPGTYLHYNFVRTEILPYWELEKKTTKKTVKNEEKAKAELKDLLTKSVASRMQNSSSLGVFLSGGIDSSLITAIAQEQAQQPLSTFSIGFENEQFDESDWAKKVATQLKTNHTEYTIQLKDVLEIIPTLPRIYEEPYADASAIPTLLVSKLAKEKVEVVLTGDGGDEQFLGYGMYTWADRLTTLKTVRWFMKKGLRLSSQLNRQRAAQYFDFTEREHFPTHVFSADQGMFSSTQLKRFFTFEEEYLPFALKKTARRLLVSETQALYDLKYYLPGDLVTKVARATENHQLTARMPLLSHELLEWSINLDESLKRKKEDTKYLLKQVLFDYLPKELFDRPKWGFGIPLNQWLSKELKPLLEEYVNPSVLSQYNFYNVEEIMKLKEEYLAGKTYLYNQLWLIIMFNMWAAGKK